MKYLMMIYGKQSDYDAMSGGSGGSGPVWTEQDLKAMYSHMEGINNDLAESGELVDAQGLTQPADARTVAPGSGGRAVVTDGPYGETKEVLAGYWVLDCANIDRVTEIADRVLQCPQPEGAPTYPLVIRPIQSGAEC